MKKKILMVTGVVLLSLSMATGAFAANQRSNFRDGMSNGYQHRGTGCSNRNIMFDQNGALLSKADFELSLEKAIKDGLISEGDKTFYINMHENMTTNGAGRGGCGNRRNKTWN